MAYNDTNFYDWADNSPTEEHNSPKCKMIYKRFWMKGKCYFIFTRQCFCDKYDHIENKDIRFKDYDDMTKDGVFIHSDKKCYRRYSQFKDGNKVYVLALMCYCTRDTYISYIK